jgi:Lon protease-like protein
MVQPLHVFEPRYREMMADTLADQSAIGLCLLKPGWEKEYYGSPAVFTVLCVGKIIAHEKLDDGKYNLLLHGQTRGAITSEFKHHLYRMAKVTAIPDSPAEPENESQDAVQRQVLRSVLKKTAIKELTITPSLETFFEEGIPTARLIDLLAFNLVQNVMMRQRLLEERDPRKRGEMLLQSLMNLAAELEGNQKPAAAVQPPNWPPPLSTN